MDIPGWITFFGCLIPLYGFADVNDRTGISVKPYINSYTQARVDLQRDTLVYKQEKMIFGMDIRMNKHWTAKLGADLAQMTKLYLKPAVMTYQKEKWAVDGGLFFTGEMDKTMPLFWENRFMEKAADERRNVSKDGSAVIGGLIFRCFPSVRFSVDYWNKRPSVKHIDREDWLYFCVEFKY